MHSGTCRETRKGRALLTAKTEVNGDSKRTNERGPCLVGLLGLPCRYKRFMFCLGWSSRPVQNLFFLTIHYFNFFVLIAQQGGQVAVPGRLSPSVCLWGNLSLAVLIIQVSKKVLLNFLSARKRKPIDLLIRVGNF
jgi:hypothetical protein